VSSPLQALGYGDIHPVGIAGKAMACIEIVSGLVMFGILLTFISSRFQRT
jgi:Ion channel